MKRWLPVVGAAAVLYAGTGAALIRWQERLIFPAPAMQRAMLDAVAAQVGARPIELVASDGVRLYGWHRPAQRRRAVLFFHGNSETLADRVPLHDFLVRLGWDVVLVAYRGYPGSEGRPTEEGLARDARAALEHVVGQLGIAPERTVLHGKSLGGGVAARLAWEAPVGGLVLESTFPSIPEVAAWRVPVFPARLFLRHRFPTRVRAKGIEAPVLILHGDRDLTIPVRHGRVLARAFRNGTYVEVPWAGHGETLPIMDPRAQDAYLALLKAVPAVPG